MKVKDLLKIMNPSDEVKFYTKSGKILCQTQVINIPIYIHDSNIINITSNVFKSEACGILVPVTIITIEWR